MKKKIKLVTAWAIGLASFLAISYFLELPFKYLNIPTYIDFGQTIIVNHGHYEEEIDGTFTAGGQMALWLSIMFASRIAMAFYENNLNGGVSRKGNITFSYWAIGIFIYGILGTIIYKLFQTSKSDFIYYTGNLLELALIVSLLYYGHKSAMEKIDKIASERESK